jgi:hypothetical protein
MFNGNDSATKNELNLLYTIQVIFSSITILSVILSIILFACFRSIRTFAVELIFYLCITEMIANMFNLIPFDLLIKDANLICYLQSFSEMFFPLASMIITTFICAFAYISSKYELIYHMHKSQIRTYILCFTLIISSVFGFSVFIFELIGKTSTSCFLDFATVDNKKKRSISILIYTYYSLFIVLILISLKFISSTKKLLGNIPELNTEEISKYLNKLRLYPLIQFITTIPAAAHRIFQLYNNNFNISFEVIQTISDSLRGALFVIFFVLSPGVLKLLFKSREKKKKEAIEIKNCLNSTFLLLDSSYYSINDSEVKKCSEKDELSLK